MKQLLASLQLILCVSFLTNFLVAMRHNPYNTKKFNQTVAGIRKKGATVFLIELLDSMPNTKLRWHTIAEQIQKLISDGANPNCISSKTDLTALMVAGGRGLPIVVNFLLQKGANPNQLNKQKSNALMLILQSPKVCETVAKLLINVTDLKQCNISGKDALRYALTYEHPQEADLLINCGADPERIIEGKDSLEFVKHMIDQARGNFQTRRLGMILRNYKVPSYFDVFLKPKSKIL